MRLTNRQLLSSGVALRQLMSANMKGHYSLRLKRLAPKFDEEIKRVQKHREELVEEKDEEVAEKEWQDILDDTLELPGEKLNEEAIYNAEVSAHALEVLDWLIDFESPTRNESLPEKSDDRDTE